MKLGDDPLGEFSFWLLIDSHFCYYKKFLVDFKVFQLNSRLGSFVQLLQVKEVVYISNGSKTSR